MQDLHPIPGTDGRIFPPSPQGVAQQLPSEHRPHPRPRPQPPLQPQPNLKCPRCDSLNTKFCYFNNYNLSQPRHFCRSCRRYWTKGGVLRNVPVGGGCRKSSKRSHPSTSPSSRAPKHVSKPNDNPEPSPAAAPGPSWNLGSCPGLEGAPTAEEIALPCVGSIAAMIGGMESQSIFGYGFPDLSLLAPLPPPMAEELSGMPFVDLMDPVAGIEWQRGLDPAAGGLDVGGGDAVGGGFWTEMETETEMDPSLYLP